MRIDTRSRPASFVGMEHERAALEAWFKQYQQLDHTAQLVVEETNVFKSGDVVFYMSSNQTLAEIQQDAVAARKAMKS